MVVVLGYAQKLVLEVAAQVVDRDVPMDARGAPDAQVKVKVLQALQTLLVVPNAEAVVLVVVWTVVIQHVQGIALQAVRALVLEVVKMAVMQPVMMLVEHQVSVFQVVAIYAEINVQKHVLPSVQGHAQKHVDLDALVIV